MSIVKAPNEDIYQILEIFGIDKIKNVTEVHIHITTNEAVMLEIKKYADINISQETEYKQYNLVEVVK